jgi:hypothetical protein
MRPEINRKSSAQASGVRLHPRGQSEEKRPSFWYLHPRYQSEERHCLWPPVSDQTCFSRSRPLLCAVAPRSTGREAPELLVSSSPISIGRKALPLVSSERSDLDLAHCCLLLPRGQSSEEKHLSFFWYLSSPISIGREARLLVFHPRARSIGRRLWAAHEARTQCFWATRPGYFFPASKEGRRGQVIFSLRRWRLWATRPGFFFPLTR